jgi:CRISPR-associated protein Cas2
MAEDGLYVVCYDIPDDRLRTRIANRLVDFGARIQYSVFECWLSPFGRDTMLTALRQLLDDEDGMIAVYHIGTDYESRRVVIGEQLDTRPPESYIF